MANAKLIIRSPGGADRELQLSGSASIGRAFDNSVRIEAEDVSRYHAVIEHRADGFWLSDLGSRNGTTVNGAKLAAERKLEDADLVLLGGMATLEFHVNGVTASAKSHGAEPNSTSDDFEAPDATPPLKSKERSSSTGAGPAILIGLAIVAVVAGVFIIAQIISRSRSIDDDTNKGAKSQPTASTKSSAEVERDRSGQTAPQDNRHREQDGSNPGATRGLEPETGGATPASLGTVQMCQNLAGLIVSKSGSGYVFPPGFVAQVRNHLDEYRVDMTERVRSHRFEINKAFQATPLHSVTGYLLAISRSGFKEDPSDSGVIGMWRVPKEIALSYKAPEDPESIINDPTRSAEVAARHFKGLIDVFGQDDFMYAIACFGVPTSTAGDIRAMLDKSDAAERRDFWRMAERGVVPPDGADRVVRFFAAGIVAENPRAFGMDSKPLSWLMSN